MPFPYSFILIILMSTHNTRRIKIADIKKVSVVNRHKNSPEKYKPVMLMI